MATYDNDWERIDAYLHDEMTAEERAAFTVRLEQDEQLKQELAAYQALYEGVKRTALRQKIKALEAQLPPLTPSAAPPLQENASTGARPKGSDSQSGLPGRLHRLRPVLALAAALALVLSFYFLLPEPEQPPALQTTDLQTQLRTLPATGYIEPAPAGFRSETDSSPLALAQEEYTDGDFQTGLGCLEDMTPSDSSYLAAQFWRGHLLFRLERYNAAQAAFQEVETLRDNPRYRRETVNFDNAGWTLLLARAGQLAANFSPEKAAELRTATREFLDRANPTDRYYQQAERLLDLLTAR